VDEVDSDGDRGGRGGGLRSPSGYGLRRGADLGGAADPIGVADLAGVEDLGGAADPIGVADLAGVEDLGGAAVARHVPAKPRSSSSPQAEVEVQAVVDNRQESVAVRTAGGFQSSASESVQPVTAAPETAVATVRVPLSTLCWARSGDKGDMSNIGVIARRAEWLPFLRTWLTEERVLDWFSHAVHGAPSRSEHSDPSTAIRAHGSEHSDPSTRIRAQRSEHTDPSIAIRAHGSEHSDPSTRIRA
jgi:hypothetical protein